MRDHILREIQRITGANGGKAPGAQLFARESGIAEHHWRGKYWARWGDALTEAGFEPNQWVQRLDSDVVLDSVTAACRHYGHFPTNSEMGLYRRSNPDMPAEQVLRRHFGSKAGL